MKYRRMLVSVVTGFMLFSTSAFASDKDAFSQLEMLPDPQVLLRNVVTDDDVSLLFAHLRATLLAAAEGRQAPLSAELGQRAEAIGKELRLRGTLAGLLMLMAFESAARQALREALGDPVPAAR